MVLFYFVDNVEAFKDTIVTFLPSVIVILSENIGFIVSSVIKLIMKKAPIIHK